MSAARRDYELSKDAEEDKPTGTLFSGDPNAPKRKKNTAQVQERKLPFFVDVFLFPISLAGIIQVVVYVIASFVLRVLPIGICWGIIMVVVNGYMYWYFCECIRDSAVGAIRAPDVITTHPDIPDAISEFRRIVALMVLFALPSVAYYVYTRQVDTPFWIITGAVGLFFPISLLAVVMYGYLSAMNPILIIRSVIAAPLGYVGTIAVFWVLVGVSEFLRVLMSATIALDLLGSAFLTYMTLVAGHVLGRFYFNNSEKLDWEV